MLWNFLLFICFFFLTNNNTRSLPLNNVRIISMWLLCGHMSQFILAFELTKLIPPNPQIHQVVLSPNRLNRFRFRFHHSLFFAS